VEQGFLDVIALVELDLLSGFVTDGHNLLAYCTASASSKGVTRLLPVSRSCMRAGLSERSFLNWEEPLTIWLSTMFKTVTILSCSLCEGLTARGRTTEKSQAVTMCAARPRWFPPRASSGRGQWD